MIRALPRLAIIALLCGWPVAARAQSADRLANAKDLFHRGVTLLQAGNVERALEYFLRSREAVPSSQNTADAAICLDRLGRYDEALEMYEELAASFGRDLDDDDRRSLGPAMAALRRKLGTVAVTSNVPGSVVVDGRPRGRLPLPLPIRLTGGHHVLRVTASGFATFERGIDVTVGAELAIDAQLAPLVPVDLHAGPPPSPHPRPRTGVFFVEAYGGYAGGATLDGDAEHACPSRCSRRSPVGGGLAGLRAGYQLEGGFALELTGGYASFGATLARTAIGHYQAPPQVIAETYTLADDLRVQGAFIGGGPSFHLALGRPLGPTRWALVARTTAGALFTASTDPITGSVNVGAESAPVKVSTQHEIQRSQALFVMPALGAEVGWRSLRVSLTLGAAFFPLAGPRFNHTQTGVSPSCGASANPATPGCAPNAAVVAQERAYGPFLLWVPQASAGLVF